MCNYKQVIAIDGPAGAGKSTIARKVAQEMKYIYIDTGAMYRAVAWKVLQKANVNITEELICDEVKDINISLGYAEDGEMTIAVNGEDISSAIRTPKVTELVSKVAAVGQVREKMVKIQRKMASNGKVIMDGRDIGTCVLPNADLKIFLTASVEERAKRRMLQLETKGFKVDIKQLQEEIAARDKADMQREISPLVQAKDAILLDTTEMTIEEVINTIIAMIKE